MGQSSRIHAFCNRCKIYNERDTGTMWQTISTTLSAQVPTAYTKGCEMAKLALCTSTSVWSVHLLIKRTPARPKQVLSEHIIFRQV